MTMTKKTINNNMAPIGIFDSGYGGLTILKEIRKILPQYDYIYLGDNARSPYGSRSFDIINQFTTQAVEYLWNMDIPLTILACNTASAKSLRKIQQEVLPLSIDPTRRVLGVIRPTVESIGNISKTRHIGVFATQGTVSSNSYEVEVHKLYPDIKINQVACPMWVPIVEYGYADSDGTDFFIKDRIDELLNIDREIDVIILGCTHYPLLKDKIMKYTPKDIKIVSQGELVAYSLKDYLNRHPEMEKRLSKNASVKYLTTESSEKFDNLASIFIKDRVDAKKVVIY